MSSGAGTSFATLPTGAKVGLLFLALGLVSALYYFAFHMSLSDDIAAAEQQHIALQAEYEAALARQADFLRLSQELALRAAIDRDNRRVLPEQAEIPAFLQDLNRLAELSRLQIATVEPRPEEPEEQFVKIPVSLQVSGRYHQIEKFFYNVSRLERAIGMEDVTIATPVIQGDAVRLTIEVRATTFRRPDAEEEAAAAAAGAAGGAAPAQAGGGGA